VNGWHRGPPPSIGWWPTRGAADKYESLRWWDGIKWGLGVTEGCTPEFAEWAAQRTSLAQDIRWSERPADWPKRSRR
jgi:hypothetical protein